MITYWHNPRCSKSREGLKLLQDAGVGPEIRRYLEDAPDAAELRALRDMLDVPVIEMMRVKEPAFKAAGLSRDSDAEALIAAMVQEPRLIERPVAIRDGRAVIGRPPERVLSLVD